MPEFESTVYTNQNVISFVGYDQEFSSKLLDCKYVDYKRVIFEGGNKVTVNKIDFLDAVKSAIITSNAETNAIELNFGSDSYIKSKGGQNESVIGFDCDCSFDCSMAINAKYLSDTISAIEDEAIEIGIDDKGLSFNTSTINSIITKVKI